MLLVVVLGIWGIIGYKVYSALNPELPKIIPNKNPNKNFKMVPKAKKDTFSITMVKRDPFLGTIYSPKKQSKKSKSPIVKTPKENIPQVTYHGNITKQDGKARIFVISVNGKQHLLKIGQKTKDLTLLNGNSKEIFVRINNTKIKIAKL